MPETMQFLPSISEVDVADDAIGKFLSDLDWFASAAEKFRGDDVSLEDHVFMDRNGIEFENAPRHVDPAIIARLLVFADEAIDDADKIKRDAERLRGELLTIYRGFVIERSRQRRSDDA
jgi:hypothetical protein